MSAAYHALFHHTVLSMTQHLQPTAPDEIRYELARHVSHQAVKQVCAWTATPDRAPMKVRQAATLMHTNGDLVKFALTFATLYDSRHDADYNHLADFHRDLALGVIAEARAAIGGLDRAIGSPQAEVFFAHVAVTSNL